MDDPMTAFWADVPREIFCPFVSKSALRCDSTSSSPRNNRCSCGDDVRDLTALQQVAVSDRRES
jgi:hypothetical protein